MAQEHRQWYPVLSRANSSTCLHSAQALSSAAPSVHTPQAAHRLALSIRTK